MDPTLTRLALLAVVLLAAAGLGIWWQRRQGLVRAVVPDDALSPIAPDELGASLGARATLVQFSSTACAPCRTTRRLLTDVVSGQEGLAHIELDAEQHLPLVRRLGVMRTPTVFVLDRQGRPVHRVSGVPELPALRTALAGLSA